MELNDTTYFTAEYILFENTMCESLAIAIYILASLGVAGNVMTFIVIHTKGTKHSTNILLKWICIIDSCTLLALALYYYVNSFTKYRIHCVAYIILLMFLLPLQVTSAWSVVLLGYQRYRAVCYPINVLRGYSSKRQKIRLLIVTLLATLVSLPCVIDSTYWLWLQVSRRHYVFYCNIQWIAIVHGTSFASVIFHDSHKLCLENKHP